MAYAKFHATASGNNCVVAAQSGKTIRIQAVFFQCGALTEVTLRSGTTAAGDLTGAMQFQTGGGLNLPYAGFDLFVCNEGEQFTLKLAGIAPDCAGALLYTQE